MTNSEPEEFLPFELEVVKQGVILANEFLAGMIASAPDGFHRVMASNEKWGAYLFIKEGNNVYLDNDTYDISETAGCILGSLLENEQAVITLRSIDLSILEKLNPLPEIFDNDLIECSLRSWILDWSGAKAMSAKDIQAIHELFLEKTGLDISHKVKFESGWPIKA